MLTRQIYLHAQLRLPSLYYSRDSRIFQDTAVSWPEIQCAIYAYEAEGNDGAQYRATGAVLPFPGDWVPVECLACIGQVQALVRGFRRIAGESV
jgi:hypothetical protein